MKKLLCVAILAASCLLSGCGGSSANNTSTKPAYVSQKDLAEQEAIKWLAEEVVENEYSLENTKYKIGSIIEEDGYFEVYGVAYLYDKYGNLDDSTNFTCYVNVEYDGSMRVSDSLSDFWG